MVWVVTACMASTRHLEVPVSEAGFAWDTAGDGWRSLSGSCRGATRVRGTRVVCLRCMEAPASRAAVPALGDRCGLHPMGDRAPGESIRGRVKLSCIPFHEAPSSLPALARVHATPARPTRTAPLTMVYVLPLPVAPYANTVVLMPWRRRGTGHTQPTATGEYPPKGSPQQTDRPCIRPRDKRSSRFNKRLAGPGLSYAPATPQMTCPACPHVPLCAICSAHAVPHLQHAAHQVPHRPVVHIPVGALRGREKHSGHMHNGRRNAADKFGKARQLHRIDGLRCYGWMHWVP